MAGFLHSRIARRLAEGDTAATTEEKGSALEDVVIHSFCKIKSVDLLRRDQKNDAGSAEIDLLLFNGRHRLGIPFLPEYLIFECKNWSSAVDSATIRDFVTKIRNCRLEFGILIAANGITGDPHQRTSANDIIRQAFERDNIKILVITRAEIESFRRVADIIVLLRERFGELIMGLGAIR